MTRKYTFKLTEKNLRKFYLTKNMTIKQVAEKCRCKTWQVTYRLRKYEIYKRGSKKDARKKDGRCTKPKISKATLKKLYIVKGMTLRNIAGKLGHEWHTVAYYVARYNLQRKHYKRSAPSAREPKYKFVYKKKAVRPCDVHHYLFRPF